MPLRMQKYEIILKQQTFLKGNLDKKTLTSPLPSLMNHHVKSQYLPLLPFIEV